MQRVGDLSDELRMLLSEHLHVHCDLSDVEAIDAMGLQLLLAARTRQLAKGGTLTFVSVSKPVSVPDEDPGSRSLRDPTRA